MHKQIQSWLTQLWKIFEPTSRFQTTLPKKEQSMEEISARHISIQVFLCATANISLKWLPNVNMQAYF